MNNKLTVLVTFALLMICSATEAQGVLNRLGNAAERAAERAVTRQTEQRTERAVNNAIDNALDGNNQLPSQQQQQQPPANVGQPTNTANVPVASNAQTSQAQNTFFPTRAGMTILYVHQNARGNADSYTRHTFKNVEGSGNNLTISYVMESFDKNMKPQGSEIPCTVVIKDGVVFLDMNEMFIDQMKTSDLKVEITGVPMELPGNLQPGQSLKDANMTLTIDAGIIKMRTDITMTDGKCEAIEDVTVRAGTFTCHKVTQTVTTTVMRRDVVAKSIAWYAPGIGTIKTETYDNKNKLTGSMELMSIEN